MITNSLIQKCCGCQACRNICPQQCISMEADNEGFLYPKIDYAKCINCNLCSKVCLLNASDANRNNNDVLVMAAKSKNEKDRLASSSGGMFTILAESILSKGGIVYGVSFSSDFAKVKHTRIDTKEDLYKIRGSKYIQSEINLSYQQVKKDLINDKLVLFSGTPCQIAGLSLFLGRKYGKLFLVEIICHGVPSPLLWQNYIKEIARKYQNPIENVNFRSKRNGWKRFIVSQELGLNYLFIPKNEDPFLLMFLRDYCLRPSCYECVAKEIEVMADISLGDFWGIDDFDSSFNDGKGTSLVIVRSQKGAELLSFSDDKFIAVKSDIDFVRKNNPAIFKSASYSSKRKSFFDYLNIHGFKRTKIKYGMPTFKTRIKKVLRKGNNNYGILFTFKNH